MAAAVREMIYEFLRRWYEPAEREDRSLQDHQVKDDGGPNDSAALRVHAEAMPAD